MQRARLNYTGTAPKTLAMMRRNLQERVSEYCTYQSCLRMRSKYLSASLSTTGWREEKTALNPSRHETDLQQFFQ